MFFGGNFYVTSSRDSAVPSSLSRPQLRLSDGWSLNWHLLIHTGTQNAKHLERNSNPTTSPNTCRLFCALQKHFQLLWSTTLFSTPQSMTLSRVSYGKKNLIFFKMPKTGTDMLPNANLLSYMAPKWESQPRLRVPRLGQSPCTRGAVAQSCLPGPAQHPGAEKSPAADRLRRCAMQPQTRTTGNGFAKQEGAVGCALAG